MKGVILVAGRGVRLDSHTRHKPKALISILGLTLIERILLTLKVTGIRELIVVTGYLWAMIEKELGTGEKYGVSIEYAHNPDWEKGNAVSVLVVAKLVGEEFLLVIGDHLIEREMVEELLKCRGDLNLCVDSEPKNVDIEEATRVFVEDEKLVEIRKGLERFNTVDTGLFLCAKQIFPALRKCVLEGDEDWSEFVKCFAEKNRVETVDVPGALWVDIDTVDDVRRAKTVLLDSLTKPTDGVISKNINRRISKRISSVLSRTEISPNQISFIAFMLGMFSTLLFSHGTVFSSIFGGILAQATSVVDGCDGEVARLRFKASKYGAWFDAVLDRYADAFITLGMTYGTWVSTGNSWMMLLGFLALIGSYGISYSADRYEGAFREKYHGTGFRIPMGRDVRLFVIMMGGLLNQTTLALLVIAVFANIEVIRRLVTEMNPRRSILEDLKNPSANPSHQG